MDKREITVAMVQAPPVFLNLEATLTKVNQLAEEAAGEGAQLVVFPETWLPGYPVWLDFAPEAALWDHPPAKELYRTLAANSVVLGSDAEQQLQAVAREHTLYLVIGVHERIKRTLYNTILTITPEGEIHRHRKLVPTYTERLVWGRGDGSTLSAVNTPYGVLGSLVCWEHWMPFARAVMHDQNEAIHVAQWPYVKELHQIASRQYAFEGQCYVLASGCCMRKSEMMDGANSLGTLSKDALALLEAIPLKEEEWVLNGGSAVIRPDTSYQVEPVRENPDTIYTKLNLEQLQEGNLFLDTDGHYSRPDIFQLSVNTDPQQNVSYE